MKKILLTAIMTAGLAGMSACSIVPSQPDLAVYQLDSASKIQRVGGAPSPYSLEMTTPYSSEYLDSNRIAVRTVNGELQVYEGVRWNDRAPLMFRDNLAQAIRNAGLFSSVSDSSVQQKQLTLKLYVNRFQIEYRSANEPVAVIDVDANLAAGDNREQVLSRHFAVEVPAQDVKVPAVVQAFDEANGQLQQQMIAWLQGLLRR